MPHHPNPVKTVSCEWDFGDGTTANGSIVIHRFTTPGFYEVTMEATDPDSGVVTPCMRTLYVWDATPPLFNGLESAEAGSCCVNLGWNSAVDNSSFVLYHVYMRKKGEVFNYSKPCFITLDTFCTINDLKAGVTYFFLVRARDAAGNVDSNMVVKSATPFDHTPPVFEGLKEVYNISNTPCKVFLSWDRAEDSSPPVVYNIYMATSSGGYNFSKPYDSTTSEGYVVKGLWNRRYYFVVRAEDTWGNEDDNMVEMNVTPLWDNISPEIAVVEASPSLQEAGETVNISCNVTDNYAVNQVFLNITYPDSSVKNISITGNRTGGVYYCNQSYSVTGTYSYFIWANDACGNSNTSVKHSFVIQDTTPPRITDVNSFPDPQCEDGYVNISCNVTDNSEVNVVKVNITYPDGSTVNITMSDKGCYYYNTTYSLLGVYHYFICVNDTSQNVNVSDVYSFEIHQCDTTPPVTSKTVGEPKHGSNDEWVTSHTLFNLTAQDNPGETGVDKTYYRIWYKGVWTPWMECSRNFTLSGECKHYIEYYSTDKAGNVEEVHNQTHYVDDTSPSSNIIIGEPRFNWTQHLLTKIIQNIPPELVKIYSSLPLFVTNHTCFRLKAMDQGPCPVGAKAILYRTWNTFDGWSKWKKYEEKQNSITSAKLGFTLQKQGPNHIQYYSQDLLQNKEKPVHNQTCIVDATPPETTATGYNPIILKTAEHGGRYTFKGPTSKKPDKEFPLVGLFYIHYRYKIGEQGEWSNWFTSSPQYFTGYVMITHNSILDPIYVDYYATDALGNKEETHHDVFINEVKPVSSPPK
ncbi:MAG TPA: PKD domain-containing protein, partial [Thermoplasmata archaeon]|nr:PKD domain-containing protein [Thermoplasmata archaeon]